MFDDDDAPDEKKVPTRLTREKLAELPRSEKLGRFDYIGKTIRILEILGGFDTGENLSLADKLFEMDAEEAEHITNKDPVGSKLTKNGNEKKYRSWRTLHVEKIRSGNASISTLEADRLYYELGSTLGPEVANLFDPNEMATLHPKKLIGRIVTAGAGLVHPLKNPILLLRVLAELGRDPKPVIAIGDVDRLRMTDQGDERSDGLELIHKLPVLKVKESFVLEIELSGAESKEVIVFEYANAEMAKPGENQPKLAVPMPYLQKYGDKIRVVNVDDEALIAGKALGQFGFCVVAAPMTAPGTETLGQKLGIDPDVDRWSSEDMQRFTQNLRKYLTRGDPEISIALFDYNKHPA